MTSTGILDKLTFGFGVICVWLILGFVTSELKSAPLIDDSCGDPILKMRCAYPQRDEYPYIPECCMVKMESKRFENESKALPANLALAVNKCVSSLGKESYQYLHHFCAGMNRLKRYQRSLTAGMGSFSSMAEKQEKQRQTLLSAISEFKMIESIYLSARSPLYTEIIINYAKALRLLGRTAEAISKMTQGISAEPENDVIYLYLAQTLLELGDKKQAKKVLELAYKRTNGSKRIGEMLARLSEPRGQK